jgi:hypothetical protein
MAGGASTDVVSTSVEACNADNTSIDVEGASGLKEPVSPLRDTRNSLHENITEFREILSKYATRSFRRFRTEYGRFGSPKNKHNSVSTEFRGHLMHEYMRKRSLAA